MNAAGTIPLFRRPDAALVRQRFGLVNWGTVRGILPEGATDEQWREARRAGVGASEMAVLLEVGGTGLSPFALWWAKKTGWNQADTPEMSMGVRLEAAIGAMWQDANRDAVLVRAFPRLFADPRHPHMLCTPDFLAIRRVDLGPAGKRVVLEPVECKAYDGGAWGTPGTDEVPEHIAIQVAMQCGVLGAKRGHVARLHNKRFTTYTIEWQPFALHYPRWTDIATEFLRAVAEDAPPPIDAHPTTTAVLEDMYPVVDEAMEVYFSEDEAAAYRAAVRLNAEAAETLALQRNLIRARLGAAKTGVSTGTGTPFVERRIYKRRRYEVPAGLVDAIHPIDRRVSK